MYEWRWWRRLVVAGWMLAALVLVRSYAGNLMSVLAVRHVRQPFQRLRDVLDDPAVVMIWQTNTSNVEYFRVRTLCDEYMNSIQFWSTADFLLRYPRGDRCLYYLLKMNVCIKYFA